VIQSVHQSSAGLVMQARCPGFTLMTADDASCAPMSQRHLQLPRALSSVEPETLASTASLHRVESRSTLGATSCADGTDSRFHFASSTGQQAMSFCYIAQQ